MEISRRLRKISKKNALESFNELESLEYKDIGVHSRIGLACLDYFFLRHRIKAKTKRHISFFDSLKDDTLLEYINGKVEQVKKLKKSDLSDDELLRERYSVFQLYYGTINQFRPTEAKRVYYTLKPKVGILDFSAGWGGRCLAAMAYGVPYIGIDANKNMEKSYKEMIELVNPKESTKIIFQPSETVDFSRFKYDLIFTSPPYFTLEEYQSMPDYGSREGFLEKFFRPVALNAWKHLSRSGHMALNMPKEMYDSIKGILPRIWKRMRLPISNRHPTNAVEGRAIGEKDNKPRSEIIYIWKKTRNLTRKVRK
jgi:hypothetical protein